jgi:hypothetical protein
MAFIPNKDGDRAFLSHLANKLAIANQAGADYSKSVAPVQSGALRSTIKSIPVAITDSSIVSGIKAGGVADNGELVDYALDMEIRDGYLRHGRSAIGRVFFER